MGDRMSVITPKLVVILAAINGLLAVILGAFGAHGLKNTLSAAALQTYQTGVDYQMYHALALLGLGVFMLQQKNAVMSSHASLLSLSALLMVAGIILFCGSLYGLSLGGPRILGPITPLGGLCFLFAWLSIVVYSIKVL